MKSGKLGDKPAKFFKDNPEETDFEDVIRTAVSLGGDCDTLTCIAGSMGEAFYKISDNMIEECRNRLSKDILGVVDRFMEAKR